MAKKVNLEPVKETKPMPKNELIKLTEKKDSQAILLNDVKIYPAYHKPANVGMLVEKDKNPLTKAPYEFMRYTDNLHEESCYIYIFEANGHTQFLYLFGNAEVKEIELCRWSGVPNNAVYIINNTKVDTLKLEGGKYGLIDCAYIKVGKLILNNSIYVTTLSKDGETPNERTYGEDQENITTMCLRSAHVLNSKLLSKKVYVTRSEINRTFINSEELRVSNSRVTDTMLRTNKCDFNNTIATKFIFTGYGVCFTVHNNKLSGEYPSMFGGTRSICSYSKGDISLLTPLLDNNRFLMYCTVGGEYVLAGNGPKDVTGEDLFDYEVIASILNTSDFVAKDLVASVKKRIELVKLIKDLGLSSDVNIVPWHEESDIF